MFTVNSTLDEHLSATANGRCVSTPSGVCTLRAAIDEINTAGSGVLSVPAGTYVLRLGSILITGAPTISGAGAGATVIDGAGLDRIFEVETTGNAYIANVTLQHGRGTAGLEDHGHGGCIHVHGRLTLVNATVRDCIAQDGWGGGGIASSDTATLTLVNDTVANNIGEFNAGIQNSGGPTTLDNVTIANNLAVVAGGGISGGDMRINNTILAYNAADNCDSNVAEALGSGNNLEDGQSCALAGAGDLRNADPLLGALRADGTLALLPGSPAIDAGDSSSANCPATDERGLARPQDGHGTGVAICDIGAYEAPSALHVTATVVGCSPNPITAGASTLCTAHVSDHYAGPKLPPTGTVSLTSGGAGSFSASGSCRLTPAGPGQATCAVSYTPLATGRQTITAAYGGDGMDGPSTAGTPVTVTNRATGLAVGCSPHRFTVGDSTRCTAHVNDKSTGSKLTPRGTVSFTSGRAHSFTLHGSCALRQAGGGVASCPVGYTSLSPGTHTITARYHGDGAHATASGGTKVTVVEPVSSRGCRVHANGSIIAANGDKSSFVITAQAKTPRGSLRYRDGGPALPIRVRSLSIRSLTCRTREVTASMFGKASIDGAGSFDYRVDIRPSGRGRRHGSYRVRLSSGYDSGSELIQKGTTTIRHQTSRSTHGSDFGSSTAASGRRSILPRTLTRARDASHATDLASAASPEAIGAGGAHTCVLLRGGAVQCWGSNGYGQLGNGSIADSLTPVSVSGITTATAIAVQAFRTCALMGAGSVECWGHNHSFADNRATDTSTPTAVQGINTATSIAAGFGHTCALVTGGHVECWGDNGLGQLGNGSTTGPDCGGSCSETPVTVTGITNATAIAAGSDQTCALLAGGGVDCWGYNASGELGNGSTTGPDCGGLCSSTPVAVNSITNATAIAASNAYACALLTDGTVDCWGRGRTGELGNGSTNDSATPVAVKGITRAAAISAGFYHACALLTGGGVDCWGYNRLGALGNGRASAPNCAGNYCAAPVPASGIANATAIAAGGYHTCALLAGNSVACWGWNGFAQFGNGTTTTTSTPVHIAGFP